MAAMGQDIIGTSGVAPFFKVENPEDVTIEAPPNRMGDALRTWVRSLSGFQKEALVRSARTGDVWRLVSDEGPYLNGHDAAPCPLAFLSTGMAASFMNEITALARQQDVEIRKLKLIQNNYYTMKGSMPKRTMVGGAENIELEVEIDCDLNDAALNELLINATCASPLNGSCAASWRASSSWQRTEPNCTRPRSRRSTDLLSQTPETTFPGPGQVPARSR